jgi:hypothetical protein
MVGKLHDCSYRHQRLIVYDEIIAQVTIATRAIAGIGETPFIQELTYINVLPI